MATGKKDRPRPSWLTATMGSVLGAALLGGSLLTIALAIDPSTPFELDGNADDNVGGGTDWAAELPLNGAGETFIVDQVPPLGSETFFTTGGSKDDNNIGSWRVASGNATNPDKNNITNAYAKSINVPFPASDLPGHPAVPHDHLVIYFGADRFANDGDAALGFWFFENEVAVSGNGFTGTHSDKDILVQVDYVNGGARAEIQVFKWQGDGTGTHGSPKVLKELAFAAADGATVCTPGNTACATTNENAITEPWPYIPKGGGPEDEMPARSFFEGAIDITALIGPVCFSSFLAETRSSHSETAQLKDLALGDFDLCSVRLPDKTCDLVANQSPVYDPVTDLYQTRHTINIENNGFGQVYDVQIQDNSVGAGTTCDIVAINGVQITNVPITSGTSWHQVADSLAGGASMTVGVLCQSTLNPLANQATVRASSSDGGLPIPPDADDTKTESGADVTACQLNLTPLLTVAKACKTLTLHPTTFKPQACVEVSVTNPVASKQYIDITSVKNYKGPGGVTGTGIDITSAFQTANGGSLALANTGLPVKFDVCYEPDGPDNGETDPAKAMYSDTVEAIGIGRAADAEVKNNGSTFCKLCPACPDCPPPPST